MPQMTATSDQTTATPASLATSPDTDLLSAAEVFGDAKLAIETWDGPATGPAWARAVADYRKAMIALSVAAVRFSAETRPDREPVTAS